MGKKKEQHRCSHGAEGRTRTGTVSLPVDFESTTSANSITSANRTYHSRKTRARRFCRNAQDAEDVAQEAAIKIYRALGRYRAEAAFSTWVYAITRNAAMDFLRRRKKVQEAEYSLPIWEFSLVLPEAGVLDAMAVREGLRALYALIEALPPAQREVLILRDVDGYAYEEIAELLGISLGTVKSRIARARAAVRQGYDRAKEQTEK